MMGDIMNQRHNISYTWDQINKILDCIKKMRKWKSIHNFKKWK